YRSGAHRRFADGVEPAMDGDIVLDERLRTITLRRQLLIDLGAVAKGLAIDLAARELAPLVNYSIDAGGDLYLAGQGPDLGWRVGIQHPGWPGALAGVLELTDLAVCTSGDYLRRGAGADEQHLVDPRTGKSPSEAASVTVVAPSAMLADGLSTAAYVLGPEKGLALVAESGAEGLVLTPRLEKIATPGMQSLLREAE
ncbi:MAG TPA: FAD:protein FMN transferase, partial [Candidatus Dormibacteraeota bacterium]